MDAGGQSRYVLPLVIVLLEKTKKSGHLGSSGAVVDGGVGHLACIANVAAESAGVSSRHLIHEASAARMRPIQVQQVRVLGLGRAESRKVVTGLGKRHGLACGAIEAAVEAVLEIIPVMIDAGVPL